MVFSCGASSSSISIILCVCACGNVRILDRKKFAVAQADTPFEEESGLLWIVTWCFLVAPATFPVILCVCVWRGAHFGS